jgi:ribosome maturation factor RimP
MHGWRWQQGDGPSAHFFVLRRGLPGYSGSKTRLAMDKEGLIVLLEPAINALGYELVDLDLLSGRGGLLLLFIDRPPAVTLADCEFVSQQIGDFLDVEDPIGGSYRLEVSSPGIDRRLRTPAHFAAVIGSEVNVELRRPVEGRRRFRGRLLVADANTIEVEVDGKNWRLPFAEVRTARLVPTD